MVCTCASLLFQVLYLILDVTFLELTYIPIFYWTTIDIDILLSLFIF